MVKLNRYGSVWDRQERIRQNDDKDTIERFLNEFGDRIQDLVAEGQLTPEEYTQLIRVVNGLISKGNVSVDDIDLNLGKIGLSHLSEEVKSAMTGDTPILSEVADGAVTRTKIANKATSPEKTGFMKIPNNLINKDFLIMGKTIDTSTGELIDSSTSAVTPFIPVETETSYTKRGTHRFFVYRPDKSYMSSSISNTYETPVNGAFLRFSINMADLDTALVTKGTSLGDYDDGYYEVGTDDFPVKILPGYNSVGEDEIKEKSIDSSHVKFVRQSPNLFDKSKVKLDTGVDTDTGEEIPTPDTFISDYIELPPGVEFTKDKLYRWAYYNENKEIIGHSTADTITTLLAGRHVRLTGLNKDINEAQVVEGTEKLPYEDYGEWIEPNLIKNSGSGGGTSDFDWLNDQDYYINGKIDGVIKNIQIEGKEDGTSDSLASYTIDDYYAEYDALMARHPDYISKSLLGYDASGEYPIYRYDFKIKRAENHGNKGQLKKKKAIITSGSHLERAGIWCLFKAMEHIADNWRDDDLLETLRWNVNFIIVPLWSPWSVANGQRVNANDINPARNFPEGFQIVDESDGKYGGTEPLSEPESQYIHQILEENKDALFHIDFHNFFNGSGFLWTYNVSRAMGMLGEEHVFRMSREWKERFPQMPQAETDYAGYATYQAESLGYVHRTAETMGIRSLTFEVDQSVYFEPDRPRHSALANSLGTEAFLNYLLMIFKYTVKEKNRRN